MSLKPSNDFVGCRVRGHSGPFWEDRYGVITDYVVDTRFGAFLQVQLDDGSRETIHNLNTEADKGVGWYLEVN